MNQAAISIKKRQVTPKSPPWIPFAGGTVIVLLTLLAYLPAIHGQFVWDDNSWTTEIPELVGSISGLEKMWFQATALQQYYPLTGTTFWIDHQLWGLHTLPYHIENILLHLTSALLFWKLLRRLKVPGAWLAAAIFALHPVMVESVAWITERKNTLSMVLFLSSLLAYGSFASFWEIEPQSAPPRWRMYALALALFTGAMLSKTTAFCFPAVILLICWWKRGRIRWADVLPTLPFFAVSIGLCLITANLEKNHVGAKGPDWQISFPARCLIAGRVVWFYVGKLLWPSQLCFVYPRWHLNPGSWQQWVYPVSVVLVLLTLWILRRSIGRGPLAASLFFIGTLFPVLGFMNAYYMTYSFVADHWTYLSSLGLFTLAAALIATAAERLHLKPAIYALAVLLLPTLAALTWRQSHAYAGMEALWRDTLAKNPDAWLAQNNLGVVLSAQGKTSEAIAHYQEALRLNPEFEQAHNNMGIILAQSGKTDEAIEQYAEAIRIEPKFPEAQYNWGVALELAGRDEEAIPHFQQVIELKHDFPSAQYNLGVILMHLGRAPEATEHLSEALKIDPDSADAHYYLGLALIQQGKFDDAIANWEQTVRLQPDYPEAHYNWGQALQNAGRNDEAISHYEQAIQLKPDFFEAQFNLGELLIHLGKTQQGTRHLEQAASIRPTSAETHNDLALALWQSGRVNDAIAEWKLAIQKKHDYPEALNGLAWLLATQKPGAGGDPAQAVAMAERACKITQYQVPGYVDTLSTAYASAGRFNDAIAAGQKAMQLAQAAGQTQLVTEIQARLQLYQSGHAFASAPAATNP